MKFLNHLGVKLLWLMALTQCVENRKRMKVTFEYFGASSIDPKYLSQFNRTAPDSNIYLVECIRSIPSLYIDIYSMTFPENRTLYQMANMNGCAFINNGILNRFIYSIYEQLIVNGSRLSCPFQPGKYYVRNQFSAKTLPSIIPAGRFLLNVKLKLNQEPNSLLDLAWIYRVIK